MCHPNIVLLPPIELDRGKSCRSNFSVLVPQLREREERAWGSPHPSPSGGSSSSREFKQACGLKQPLILKLNHSRSLWFFPPVKLRETRTGVVLLPDWLKSPDQTSKLPELLLKLISLPRPVPPGSVTHLARVWSHWNRLSSDSALVCTHCTPSLTPPPRKTPPLLIDQRIEPRKASHCLPG